MDPDALRMHSPHLTPWPIASPKLAGGGRWLSVSPHQPPGPVVVAGQGDQGARATPGGWLRIFGLAIAVPKASDACFSASRRRRDLAQAVTAAVEAGDFVAAEQALADLKAVCTAHGHASSAMTTRLQLIPTDGGELVVLTASNVTEWDALFAVPSALATGGYTVAVSNGLRTADNDGWYNNFVIILLRGSPVASANAIARGADRALCCVRSRSIARADWRASGGAVPNLGLQGRRRVL